MAETGFEDFEGLTADQKYEKLRQINREYQEKLDRNGVLRIQSMHMPNRYWEVDAEDVIYLSEGHFAPNGFRETLYLLLMAGF